MKQQTFNFISGIITCLLHYRSRMAKNRFNTLIKLVPNQSDPDNQNDWLIERSEADEFYSQCLPYNSENLFSNKLLLRSEDPNISKSMFDSSNFITMVFDLGTIMRSTQKIGFRQQEVDFIKQKADQSQKWLFAIAEFDVVLAYKTIDEQGFCIVAEVKDGENKFDKAMRITKVAYEYLGVNFGGGYQGLLPTIHTALSSEICPFSFDDKFMFGYMNENGQYFGSFDCIKKLGRAEDILEKEGKKRLADFSEVELKIPYAAEMQWIEEKKYNVLSTIGMNIVIKGGILEEKDWHVPARQMTFTPDGVHVIYNGIEEKKLSKSQVDGFESDGPVFSIITKDGEVQPCDIKRFCGLVGEFKMKGLIDIPVVCFGGYQSEETGKFIDSKYVLLVLKNIKDTDKAVELFSTNKSWSKMGLALAFPSQTNDEDLCLLVRNSAKTVSYEACWKAWSDKLKSELGIDCSEISMKKDSIIPIPRLLFE